MTIKFLSEFWCSPRYRFENQVTNFLKFKLSNNLFHNLTINLVEMGLNRKTLSKNEYKTYMIFDANVQSFGKSFK